MFQTVDYSYIVRMDGRDLSFTIVFPMLSFNALYPLIILTRQDERQRLVLDTFRSLTILELKKSLISLSELDSRGYKYTGQGGVIKVSKDILVVMKGIQVENLYKLLGSTVVDGAYIYYKLSQTNV